LINDLLQDPLLILLGLLQFTSVALLIWAVFRFPIETQTAANRQVALALGLGNRQTLFEQPFLGQILGFGVLMARRFPFFRDRVRQDLDACGNPNAYTVDEYLAICIISGLSLMAVMFVILWAALGQPDPLVLMCMPVAGFFIALVSLREQALKRTKAIGRKLPYTLDLIALLMEAGATFTEAIATLVKDEPDDELNIEMRLVQAEIDFGATRAQALQNLADRIPLESLRSVVGAINQAEALGTPLSTILKSQSSMIRMLRSVRAEEASATASMRILVPSMVILMAAVLVIFGPVILSWLEGTLFG